MQLGLRLLCRSVLCCGFILITITSCSYQESMVSDKDLIDRFSENEFRFIKLAERLESKRFILRLSDSYEVLDDSIQNTELDLDSREYIMEELISLGLEGGILRNEDFRGVFFLVQIEGYLMGGVSKGYFYSELKPKTIVNSLDNFKSEEKNDIAFLQLKENWYLFLEFSG